MIVFLENIISKYFLLPKSQHQTIYNATFISASHVWRLSQVTCMQVVWRLLWTKPTRQSLCNTSTMS